MNFKLKAYLRACGYLGQITLDYFGGDDIYPNTKTRIEIAGDHRFGEIGSYQTKLGA